MATETEKGKSPFYPGQPVPVELFAGRQNQISHILERGAGQVSQGKPIAMFIQGEYGIGKSSIAIYTQFLAQQSYNLHSIYVSLGGTKNLQGLAERILQASIQSSSFEQGKWEKLKDMMGQYLDKVSISIPLLGGLDIDMSKIKTDAPKLANENGLHQFLLKIYKHLSETGTRGIFLVLDEINGISSVPEFAHFLKGFIETNAAMSNSLPIFLVCCGTEQRRLDLIKNHPPVERIFDVVDIDIMSESEMKVFFQNAFNSVNIKIEDQALKNLVHYSAGLPKIMHHMGDAAFWADRDGVIDVHDSLTAVIGAAEEIGRKYLDQQVYKVLRSQDYRKILTKLGKAGPNKITFTRKELSADLEEGERSKLDNFFQKMKKLEVIKSGESHGEYEFTLRLAQIYNWLKTLEEKSK